MVDNLTTAQRVAAMLGNRTDCTSFLIATLQLPCGMYHTYDEGAGLYVRLSEICRIGYSARLRCDKRISDKIAYVFSDNSAIVEDGNLWGVQNDFIFATA